MLNLIGMSHLYNERPSKILQIEDPYTAFCLDEACAVIEYRIKQGEKPIVKEYKVKHYTKPSELYKQIEEGGNTKCQ